MKALRLLLTSTLCWLLLAPGTRADMVNNRAWEKFEYQNVITEENQLQPADGQLENLIAYGECASGQEVWTKFDPEGLFAGTPLDAGEWFGAVFSGAGSGAVGYTKGLVESPYTLGKGVVSGYQQIGGLAGDVMTGNSGAKAIVQNPGTALKAAGGAAVDTVKQIGQSFSTPEGIGNNVGGFVLLGGASGEVPVAKTPGTAAIDDAAAANAAAKAPPAAPSGSASDSVTVYRGVNAEHPGLPEALDGKATPRGGHSDPEAHNDGDTQSIFTSWTTSKGVATGKALEKGPGGVVLEQTVPKSTLTESPDKFGEHEVLRTGPVEGATPTVVGSP